MEAGDGVTCQACIIKALVLACMCVAFRRAMEQVFLSPVQVSLLVFGAVSELAWQSHECRGTGCVSQAAVR